MPETDYMRKRKALKNRVVSVVREIFGKYDQPNLAVYPVVGVDTSLWTEAFDWAKFKQRGGSFGILKAMHGKAVDPWFKWNYQAAKDAGVPISTYQWLSSGRAGVSPTEQAAIYAALLRDYPVDFVPFVDFESNEINPDENDLRLHVERFEAS